MTPIWQVLNATKRSEVTEDAEYMCQLARELLLNSYGMKLTRCALIPLTVLGVMLAPVMGIGAPTSQDQKKQTPKQEKKSGTTSSVTGCVDQQDGKYVLIDDPGLNRIADLEADGFPVEGFAKHVGHKVIVRGTKAAGDMPLFKVRTIETVSENCAPQNSQQGRQ
jgi:hypothetical protein